LAPYSALESPAFSQQTKRADLSGGDAMQVERERYIFIGLAILILVLLLAFAAEQLFLE